MTPDADANTALLHSCFSSWAVKTITRGRSFKDCILDPVNQFKDANGVAYLDEDLSKMPREQWAGAYVTSVCLFVTAAKHCRVESCLYWHALYRLGLGSDNLE